MKRAVLDQGLSPHTVAILNRENWDLVHVRDIGMREASDFEILAYAAKNSRVVVTLDRDFPQLLASLGSRMPSVVLIRQERLKASSLASILRLVWHSHEKELEEGCILSVNAHSTRVRKLPVL